MSEFYDEQGNLIPVDEATDPEKGFDSLAAEIWFDDEEEDIFDGYEIIDMYNG